MAKKKSMFHMSDEELGVGIPDGRPEHVVNEDLELLAFFRNLFENKIEPELKRIVGEKEHAKITRAISKKKKSRSGLN
jgi:hypothetical protein